MFQHEATRRLMWACVGCLGLASVARGAANTEIAPEQHKLSDFAVTKLLYVAEEDQPGDLKIEGLTSGGLGEKLGLRANDLVQAINGSRWLNKDEALSAFQRADVEGRIKLTLQRGATITLVTDREQRRVLTVLGLDLDQANNSADVRVKASSGVALRAGLRVGDQLLLLDGEPYRTLAVFRHMLAAHFLEQTQVTLLIESQSQERFKATLPPQTDSGRGDGPLLTRGVSSQGTGKHVAYPPFLGPTSEVVPGTNHDRRKTQANEVMTARVELYYFRDAHRVAQILNREVKSYNGAAVTQHERAAENAREQFEEQRLNRRQAETDARQSAQELHDLETELVRHVGVLRQKLEEQGATPPAAEPNGAKTPDIATLRANVEAALKNVQAKRIAALQKQALADRANDREQLAAKEQFRREVSAAKVDPDTYVDGKPDSIDPVTQVSISVIGEGVLHLRGPRLGVNKIRYMIDEIDHPVGQVKIGVMTLQVNGENGQRMENTLRRLEGHVSLARHMTTMSNQFFQRALVETANAVAVNSTGQSLPARQIPDPSPAVNSDQPWRWKKYLEAFFGDDFLAELAEVDPHSSVLNPQHKLLALNSMDTITLGEALFMTGLAKSTVREQILQRFQYYLECDLPEKEAQWIITNKLYRCADPRWRGDAERGRLKTYENAFRRYKFNSILAYFHRQYEHGELASDVLNPLQRQVIKLVQGISLEHALHAQRQAMLLKRGLIEKLDEKDSPEASNLKPLEKYFLDQQINELEERHLKACESIRGQKAALDKLIKSVVIAIEDDVTAQYYNPALENIRTAAREWDVELSAIERTTILTNNRAFGKVSPQATFEFDLPRRDIVVAEALKAAYALHKDLGPLLSDPNFTTLTKMMSNGPLNGDSAGSVKSVLPGLPSNSDQQDLLLADSTAQKHFGTELEKLVPDPAIYKMETGTGFEIRPVVQPDGQSVAFDFNYMYTTDLLEPVRANEKHLGRIKRHFINTEVQLGNLEWREISRYEVALKAERNARGVPLLEDVPVVGFLARPLPQAQKSIQKNIIIGQAAIYPTIQDLLGLKAVNLCHADINQILCDAQHEALQNDNRFRNINSRANQLLDERLRSTCPANKPMCPGPAAVETLPAPNPSLTLPLQHAAPVPPAPAAPGTSSRDSTPRVRTAIPAPEQYFSPRPRPSVNVPQSTNSSETRPLMVPATSPRSTVKPSLPIIQPASFERSMPRTDSVPVELIPAQPKKTLRSTPAGKATRTAPDAVPPQRTSITPPVQP